MKNTLFILSVCLAFTNACNQTATKNNSQNTTTEKAIVSNNPDTTKSEIVQKEIVLENTSEQTKTESTTEKKSEKKKDFFTLLSATSQSWKAGIPSGGSGTEYYFKVKINSFDNLKFDTAWINNRKFEIYISKETTAVSSEPIKFTKGDIITLRVSDIKNQNIKTENSSPPINFEGAALIAYKANDKREYFIIKEIKKESSPNRP